jgi:mannose-6-phosphate isomerase-like protein (cupin superfamily)
VADARRDIGTLAAVKTLDIRDLVAFSDDEPRRRTLLEGTHLWSEVICLQGSQGIGPARDNGADGILLVLAGEVAIQVGKGRARMKQWEAVDVPAGQDLTVRNASEEPSVVLLVVAPPPSS